MTKIYTLSDPSTLDIRYVGKTKQTLESRLSHHIHDGKYKENSRSHIHNWIKSILDKGLIPEIETIDEVEDKGYRFWELYWSYQFRSWGFDLCNIDYSKKECHRKDKLPKESIEKRLLTLKTSDRWKRHVENLSKITKQKWADGKLSNPYKNIPLERQLEIRERAKATNHQRNIEDPTRKLKHAVEWKKRPVIGTNVSTGEEIEFSSIAEAARYISYNKSTSAITDAIKYPHRIRRGYKWRYKDTSSKPE